MHKFAESLGIWSNSTQNRSKYDAYVYANVQTASR